MNHSFKSHVFAPQGICKLREVLPPRPHSASSSPTQQSGEPSKEFNPEKAREPMPRTLRARVLSVFSRPKRLGGGGGAEHRSGTAQTGGAPPLAVPAPRRSWLPPAGFTLSATWCGVGAAPFPGCPPLENGGGFPPTVDLIEGGIVLVEAFGHVKTSHFRATFRLELRSQQRGSERGQGAEKREQA